jgi:predicted enzyme related to lactoylglutathione lyase
MADHPEPVPLAASESPRFQLFMTVVKVAKWSTTVRWYTHTLGLAPVLVDRKQEFALLAAGNGRVGLQGVKDGRAAEGRSKVRLVFQVPDLDVERRKLTEQGVEVGVPIDNSEEGYREVRLRDPEGNSLTLFAWMNPESGSRFPLDGR